MKSVKNRYCLNLNLGFVVDHQVLTSLEVDPSRVNHFVIHNIDKNLTNFLNEKNISIPHAEIFYIPPLRVLPLHVDNDSINDFCKLNFIFGAQGSLMQWWKLKDPSRSMNYHTNSIGTRYIRVEVSECDLVWQQQVGQPGLVNAGVPHQVINCTNEPRWCMSFSLYDRVNKEILKWKNALKIFESYKL
jgi:hypothetical protein